MAYAGEVPWHGLGARVEKGTSIEQWQIASGLTWTAERSDVAYQAPAEDGSEGDEWYEATGYKAIYRSDTGKLFSVVSDRYKVVQPSQILEFFRDLSGEHGMEIETCGALRDGRVVWALATNGNAIKIGGTDVVKPYLLLSTSYDATKATRATYTSVRVVCNNTMQLAWGTADKEGIVSVRHSTTFDEREVKIKLGLVDEELEEFRVNAETLAATKVKQPDVNHILEQRFGSFDEKTGKLTTNSANVIEDIKRMIASAPGADMATAQGTAWGVLNGVTRYIDFGARAHSVDNRLSSAWFGTGANKKLEVARDLLELSA
jgi:phage/plasmid-like protein (TIGR03299 family)